MKQLLGICLILFAVSGFMLIAPPGVYQDEQTQEVLIQDSEVMTAFEFTILDKPNHFTSFEVFEFWANTNLAEISDLERVCISIRMPDLRMRSIEAKTQTALMNINNRIRRYATFRVNPLKRQPGGIGLNHLRDNKNLKTFQADYHLRV